MKGQLRSLAFLVASSATVVCMAATSLRGGDAAVSPELKDFRSVDITAAPRKCCRSLTAECLACAAGLTVVEFCGLRNAEAPGGHVVGCPSDSGAGGGRKPPRACCLALTAQCMACAQGVSVETLCREDPGTAGCASKGGAAAEGSNGDVEASVVAAEGGEEAVLEYEYEYEPIEYEYEYEE